MSLLSFLAVAASAQLPGTCEPKPSRITADGQVDQYGIHCHAEANHTNYGKCQQFQQFCDWVPTSRPGVSERATDLQIEDIFGETEVIASLFSSDFALNPVVQAKNGYYYRQGADGKLIPNRKSQWVHWHYDVLTSPPFNWPTGSDGNLCDCNEGEREVQSDGWAVNAGGKCGKSCTKDMLYAPTSQVGDGTYPEILEYNNTVHHRFCMRESDLVDFDWDPSYVQNMMTPLNVIYLDEFGPNGLNLQRGEKPSSWYVYGSSKPSWNKNDQTSNVYVGEHRYDTELECREAGVNYFRQLFNNDTFEMLSACDMLSSRCPAVSNRECSIACRGDSEELSAHPLFKNMGKSARLEWVKTKCAYTPYQPENDHAWPNFNVPRTNQCFGQWQIGWEDQACDGNMHQSYDNSAAFANGWCYWPNTTPDQPGCAAAQCGKVIMDGPGRPRDVKSAQECQQHCQDDENCAHWTWRPVSDWANSNMANNLNRIRSCLLKSKAQFEGAMRARWGSDGEWIWNPLDEGSKYANEWQNLDCQPNYKGDGFNHCLQCRDNDEHDKITYHSFKWRNNMISGPKFCDEPRIEHGNDINRPASFFWDGWKDLTRTIEDVPFCPAYTKESNRLPPAVATAHLEDGVVEKCIARPEYLGSGLEGSDQQLRHCNLNDFNSFTPSPNQESTCNKFYAFCQWHIAFAEPKADYKVLREKDLLLGKKTVDPSTWSSTFDFAPPTVLAQAGTGQVSKNDLPKRDDKWVFHIPHSNHISFTSCDCLEEDCARTNAECNNIADSADVLRAYFVSDKVCHLESDVSTTRFDPAPVWGKNQSYLEAVSDWTSGLGMAVGEAGAGFHWYTISKPSWNEWPQSAHNAAFSYMNFDTEYECRAWADQYWAQKRGYKNAMLSVCEMYSSTVKSVSNADCKEACLGLSGNGATWFASNCRYTPYQAESEHAWPNFYVPEKNGCFGQYQIGYEDQACDHCIHDNYSATPEFSNGWSYQPNGVQACNAQCGKFVMSDERADNGRFKAKDVKTAQECQQYCQEDSQCVAFQWRSIPDYQGADSRYIDANNDVDVVLENNHLNKVRVCALKSADQVNGALAGRWTASGGVLNENESYHNAPWLVQDSQFAQSPTEHEGNAWYLQCKYPGDSEVTAHAFKWRNNMISGPKFCDATSATKIFHGGYINGQGPEVPCPSAAALSANNGVALPVKAKDSGRTPNDKYPNLGPYPEQNQWDNIEEVEDIYTYTPGPIGDIEGETESGEQCCNFEPESCGNAWAYDCLNGSVPGCALACSENAAWEFKQKGITTCEGVHQYFIDQKFTTKTIAECAAAVAFEIPTTTTTTTVAAVCSL